MIREANEYQRLTDVYRRLSDDELLNLFIEVEELSAVAQEVLRLEIASRRLEIPLRKEGSEEAEDLSETDSLGAFARLSSPDCVWAFVENEDAQAAGEMLAAVDIQYDVVLPSNERFDMGPPRLAVLPADVERARQILSQPIPEEFRELVRKRDQFVVPNCPRCKSDDPLLESIDPSNKWSCEVCGHTWIEMAPEESLG